MATATTARPKEKRPDMTITVFRIVAIAEAVSWAGLLIAMLFKYALTENAVGVEVVGPIHGMIFLGYIVATIVVASHCRWNLKTTLIGVFAAIPPFATVIFEVWAQRSGHLRVPDTKTPA